MPSLNIKPVSRFPLSSRIKSPVAAKPNYHLALPSMFHLTKLGFGLHQLTASFCLVLQCSMHMTSQACFVLVQICSHGFVGPVKDLLNTRWFLQYHISHIVWAKRIPQGMPALIHSGLTCCHKDLKASQSRNTCKIVSRAKEEPIFLKQNQDKVGKDSWRTRHTKSLTFLELEIFQILV